MNQLKKILGLVWLLLGPAAILFMLWQANEKIREAYAAAGAITDPLKRVAAESAATNTVLQWSIIIVIFLPIAFGMVIFGKYAVKGEYDNLPEDSARLS